MKILTFVVCLLFCLQSCGAKKKKKVLPDGPVIHQLHVRSDISYRFATTEVNCRMVNPLRTSGNAIFRFNLPKSAFLSNFSIEQGGKVFHGVIKDKDFMEQEGSDEKEEQGIYESSQENQSRHTNTLRLPFKMDPYSQVSIKMTYQELITKRLDKYEHVIHIDPERVIPDLKVEVYIKEVEPIIWMKVPPMVYDHNSFVPGDAKQKYAKIKRPSKNVATVNFNPSKKKQTKLNKKGLTGQFNVQYRLNQTKDGGNVENANGFFAHFFSTQGLPPIPKDIVFILDTSGSMHGKKLTQLKDAMHNIIDSLHEYDQFNIIVFDSWIRKWKHNALAPVTKYNIRKAKEFIDKLKARRMTDINGALSEGLSFLSKQEQLGITTNNVSIIMFLTDGNPTEGETATDKILKNTRDANQGRYQLYTISFGNAVDFRFLQQVALENGGTARKVYEDSDASVQIQNIYNDIASPLLSDVHLSYIGHNIKTQKTTQRLFETYFGGSELIVSGQLKRYSRRTVVHPCVRAKASNDSISWCSPDRDEWALATKYTPEDADVTLERLWAYLTIRQLSTTCLTLDDQTKKAELNKQILKLSLTYKFLSEQTVMNLPGFGGDDTNIELLDTDELNSLTRSKLRGRGWQDKVRDSKKRRQWKRPRRYRLKGRNRKQKILKHNSEHQTISKPQAGAEIPVVAAKTSDGAVLCLPWPQNAAPAWYKILVDRGLLVRALVQQYDGKAYLAAADIMAPNIRVYASQYAIRVNQKSARWGQPLRDAGVTVTEGKVMMEPFDGLSLEIHRVASDAPTGANLLLVLGETASLTGRQTGVLAQVKSWTIQDSSVVLPNSPPVSVPVSGPYTIGVGQVTCLIPNKDIFSLLGKKPDSFKF